MQLIKTERCNYRRSFTRLLTAALALASSGCAVPYIEPTDTNVARIKFINESTNEMFIRFYGDARECTDRTNAGLVQPKSQKTLAVPAGKEIAVTFGINKNAAASKVAALGGAVGALGFVLFAPSYKDCMPTIDFNPKIGRTYSFRMNTSGGDCSYQLVTEPLENQSQREAEAMAFTQRKWIMPMGEAGPFCEKK